MKKSISKSEFMDEFRNYGREDNFSYDGLSALYDYFEDLAEDCGIEVELDVIAICCEYSEYEDLEEFQANYGDDYESLEDIENNTMVIRINDDSFIIQDF